MQFRKVKFGYLNLDSNLWPIDMQSVFKRRKTGEKNFMAPAGIEPGTSCTPDQHADHYTTISLLFKLQSFV